MEDAYLAYIHLKRFDYSSVKTITDKMLAKKPGDTFGILLQMQAVIESSYDGFDESELQEGELDQQEDLLQGIDLSMPTSLAAASRAGTRAGSAYVRPLTAAAGRPAVRGSSRLGTGRLSTARLTSGRLGTRLGTSIKNNVSGSGQAYLGGAIRLDESYAGRPVFRRLMAQYWLRPRPSFLVSPDVVPDARSALMCLRHYGTPDWFYNDRLARAYTLVQQYQEAARHLLAASRFLPRQDTALRLLHCQLLILQDRERQATSGISNSSNKENNQQNAFPFSGHTFGKPESQDADFTQESQLQALKSLRGPRRVLLERFLDQTMQYGNSTAFLLAAARLANYLGEDAAAASLYGAVLRLDTGNLESLQSLAALAEPGPARQSLLERVRLSRPSDPAVWSNLGAAAAMDGRYGDAFQLLITAIRRLNVGSHNSSFAKSSAAWRKSAQIENQGGNDTMALVLGECDRVMAAADGTDESGQNEVKNTKNRPQTQGYATYGGPRARWVLGSILYNLGCVFQQIGDLQAARDCNELALLLNDSDSQAINNLGALCYKTGQRAKAERLFQRAFELDPTNEVAARNARLLALRRGDYQQVLKISGGKDPELEAIL